MCLWISAGLCCFWVSLVWLLPGMGWLTWCCLHGAVCFSGHLIFPVQNCISTLLSLYPWHRIRCFRCMLKMCNAHHISWSHCCSTEQCCATCLQWDCLVICHLCDSFSTANFSAKSYQLDKWCVQSWELISSRWFYAHKFTALTNTSVTIQPSAV